MQTYEKNNKPPGWCHKPPASSPSLACPHPHVLRILLVWTWSYILTSSKLVHKSPTEHVTQIRDTSWRKQTGPYGEYRWMFNNFTTLCCIVGLKGFGSTHPNGCLRTRCPTSQPMNHNLLIFSYQRDIPGSTLIFSVRFLEGCLGVVWMQGGCPEAIFQKKEL